LHPIRSETDGLEGWLELDVGPDGRVDVEVEPRAHLELPVAKLSSGNPLEDRELRRRVDVRRFPTIAGDLTLMRPTGEDGRYRVAGDLTVRGVTRRYEDEMTVETVDGAAVLLSGEKTFDVRDFGVEPPRLAFLKVEPAVTVRVAILAEAVDDEEER
jgi:polyisoprenoid-binding protein YceI